MLGKANYFSFGGMTGVLCCLTCELCVTAGGSYERIQHNGPTLTETQYEAAVRMYTMEVSNSCKGLEQSPSGAVCFHDCYSCAPAAHTSNS